MTTYTTHFSALAILTRSYFQYLFLYPMTAWQSMILFTMLLSLCLIGSRNMDIINISRENILMFLAELFLFLEADTVLPHEIGIFRLSFLFCLTTSTNHLLALMELMFLWPLLQLGLMLMSWRVIFHVWLAW